MVDVIQIPNLPAATSLDGAEMFEVVQGGVSSRATVTQIADHLGAVTSVNGRTGAVVVTKTDVGLGNADNTSDANKPVSTATQTALNLKANLANPTFTGTVGGITASMVGLGNVDNTSDANKPVSTATQTALNLKTNISDLANSSDPAKGAALVGWKQSGTGAVARTVSAKLQESVSVKDFGAVGDGTTDDTAAIQAALTYVGSSIATRQLFVPNTGSVYIISAALSAPDGIVIKSDRAVVKLKSNCSPLPAAMLGNSATSGARHTGTTIEGLIFDGNRENNIDHGTPDINGNQAQAYEGTLKALVSLGYTDDVRIEGCTFMDAWGSGLWLVDCTGTVSDNVATRCRKVGLSARRFTASSYKVRFYGNRASYCNVGIHGIFGNTGLVVFGNALSYCSDQQSYPAFAYSGTYPNVWPSTGGFVDSSDPGYVSPVNPGDGAGIELTGYHSGGTQRDEYVVVSGNECSYCQFGIRAEQEAQYVAISGNVCHHNTQSGFYIYSSLGINLTGNISAFNTEHGYKVEWAPSQARPVDVSFSGNDALNNTLHAYIFEGVTACKITGGIVRDSGTGAFGFYADNTTSTVCDKISISDVDVHESGEYWLFGDGAAHANIVVQDNRFYGTPTVAKLSGFTPAVLRGNVGIVTSATGSAAVAQNDFIAINHGLDITPNTGNINLTPIADIQADGRLYVSAAPTSTQFTVVMPGGPATLTFTWSIRD